MNCLTLWDRYLVANMQWPYNIQGVSRLLGITAGGDFLGLCDEKCSYKHVSDFGRLPMPSQAKVLTGGRRLARSASRRPPVC